MVIKAQSKKTSATALLIFFLITTQLFAPIFVPRAQAIFGIGDLTFIIGSNPTATFAVANPAGPGMFSMDSIKSYILNLVAKIILATIIRAITNQIISWIQGDDGRNVGFVGNLKQTARQTADEAGGAFLQQLALTPQPPGCTPGVNCKFNGIDICTANLRSFLRISLRTPGIQQQLGCTLSDIGANAQAFFQDFQQGGWPAFIKIGLEPQNNPYGAYLIALDAKIAAEDAAGRTLGAKYQANRGGILGFEVPQDKNCRSIPEDEYDEIKNANSGTGGKAWRVKVVDTAPEEDPSYQLCDVEQITKTPGTLVSDMLSKTVGSGIDFAVASQEIDGAIVAIANALIQKILTSSAGLIAGGGGGGDENQGIFEPELGDLKFSASDVQNSALQQRLDGYIFMADDTLASLNQTIATTQQNLFAARKQINDLNAQIAALQSQPPSPERDAQIKALRDRLTPLAKSESDLETKLKTELDQQTTIIASQIELADKKRTFVFAGTPQDLARAANSLEGAIMRLAQAAQQAGSASSPKSATGDAKEDTSAMLVNAEKNVRDEVALLTAMLAEIDRLIADPLTSAEKKQLLAGQSGRRTEVAAEITRLNEQLTALQIFDSRLAAVFTNDEIRFIRQDIINRILISNRELAAANAQMIAIIPIIKP